jgi:NADH-quinone oxidoreductase subunit F
MTRLLETPTGWPRLLLGPTPAPAGLEAAVAAGAFAGLRRAIEILGPGETIAVIERSGLRGRGGAGGLAGRKWRVCAATEAPRRYVVANGYGADPAVFTDAVLMERNPWAVIEGLAIAAVAVGASEAIVAVRSTSGDAIRGLESAVAQARAAGYLGPDVLGSGVEIEMTIRPVQGGYVLGEETVLLKALEGRRAQPEQRPPHPAERGLFGLPTVVHNVATLASVPWIVTNGAEAFSAIGSPSAPGTLLVQIRGISDEGIAEVPSGTPLRAIADLVGGVPAGHRLKAILVGGPSGGLLPPEALDTPYEFESLRVAGAHVGSGSIVLADERTCTVDLARLLTRFCADEACGKTIPCRIGTRRLAEIGERLSSGLPRPTDRQLMIDLSDDIVASALCDHERLTTLPLASAARYFGAELDQHISASSCPAGVCHPIPVAGAGAH